MPVERLVVFVNAGAGSVDDEVTSQIAEAFAAASPSVELRVDEVAPAELRGRITQAWAADPRPDAIVVAGGDGTVNNAANAVADTDIVISVLPLGTFNHFAGDLGISDDLVVAAQAIVSGSVRRVDAADVNGRVFVNNSLVGLYPTMVAIRDDVMERHGWGKVRAVPVAVLRVLHRFPTHRLDLIGDKGFSRIKVRTPLLFVGNGVYETAPGSPPVRTRLDGSVLGVEVARTESRLRLARAALHTLLRGSSGADDVDRASTATLEVRSQAGRIRVAVDGEITRLDTPLRYRTRPGALLVLAPPAPER